MAFGYLAPGRTIEARLLDAVHRIGYCIARLRHGNDLLEGLIGVKNGEHTGIAGVTSLHQVFGGPKLPFCFGPSTSCATVRWLRVPLVEEAPRQLAMLLTGIRGTDYSSGIRTIAPTSTVWLFATAGRSTRRHNDRQQSF